MFLMEKAFTTLLQGKITINNRRVPIIRRSMPIDNTPCITIEQASKNQLKRRYLNGVTQGIRIDYSSRVYVNLWCNTEEERLSLLEEVHLIFMQTLANHYLRCYNFEDGVCKFLESDCEALTVSNGRSAKHQCPHPENNNYTSFFDENNIYKNTFVLSGEMNLDDRSQNQPVLRSQLQFDLEYFEVYDMGGELMDDENVRMRL